MTHWPLWVWPVAFVSLWALFTTAVFLWVWWQDRRQMRIVAEKMRQIAADHLKNTKGER